MSDEDFSGGDDGSSEYGGNSLADYGTGQQGALSYATPASTIPASSDSGSSDSGSSSGGLGSVLSGALSSGVFGGSPSLGDGYGGATGSAGADGLAALTNGGGASGLNTDPNAGYTLKDDSGIIHGTSGTAGTDKGSPIKQLASLVQDDKGNLDLSKLIKVGTGLGGVFEAYQKNKQAAAAKAAALQAAALHPAAALPTAQNFSAPQQAAVSGYFNGTQNRTPLYPSSSGISSIVPASVTRPQVGYASGGGIGAVDDGRYGAPSSSALAPVDQSGGNDVFSHILANILTGNLKSRAKEAGVGDPDPVTLQAGTKRTIPDSGQGLVPISDLLRSIPLLLKGQIGNTSDDDDPYSGGLGSGYASGAPQATPAPGMADGGAMPMGALGAGAPPPPGGAMSHGTYGLISGPGDGQSDSIPINAAAGEYMMDAETVSMLGNGDNSAGAAALDAWREALRAHKRAAPPDQIAPPTGPAQLPPGVQ